MDFSNQKSEQMPSICTRLEGSTDITGGFESFNYFENLICLFRLEKNDPKLVIKVAMHKIETLNLDRKELWRN